MKTADEPAFPCEYKDFQPSTGEQVARIQWQGLTKREYFAAMAMQGILADSDNRSYTDKVSVVAVIFADNLLAELAKEVK